VVTLVYPLLIFGGGKNYDIGQFTGISQIISGNSDLGLSENGDLNTPVITP
jgi:hypothetical protein